MAALYVRVNCRLCLQHFNESNAYEYSPMNKSMCKFLADQNVIQSLEQQFDYLFKCAGVKLMSCWDLKEHHIIIIIIKNQKGKISIDFPQHFICLWQLTKFHWWFLNSGGSSVSKALEQWSQRGGASWRFEPAWRHLSKFFRNDFYFSFVRPNRLQWYSDVG